ncbi:MAG: TIGR02678 family protein [Pirellulaceae bacterium]
MSLANTFKKRKPPANERLDAVGREERQLALRALIYQPMLAARGQSSERFALVRRHVDWLQEWFADNCGWKLVLESDFARLMKTPPDVDDATRYAVEPKSGNPFNKRRYVLFCLALASLESGDRQTTLSDLANEIISHLAADPEIREAGVRFDLNSRDQRSDLVQVVRYLLDRRVLVRIDGDEQDFLKSGRHDVLYNINRPVLSLLMNVRQGPSSIDSELPIEMRLNQLNAERQPESDEARNRMLRQKLTRRLIDDPVVYFDHLNEEELDYLTKQRGRILRRVEEATGLVPEVRAEGIAMLDDRGDITDLEMPKDGTDGHATLLIADFLSDRIRQDRQSVISIAELQRHMTELIDAHKKHWRKAVQEPGAEVHLLNDVLQRLSGLQLIEWPSEDSVKPLPAIARYGVGDQQMQNSKSTASYSESQKSFLDN